MARQTCENDLGAKTLLTYIICKPNHNSKEKKIYPKIKFLEYQKVVREYTRYLIETTSAGPCRRNSGHVVMS